MDNSDGVGNPEPFILSILTSRQHVHPSHQLDYAIISVADAFTIGRETVSLLGQNGIVIER